MTEYWANILQDVWSIEADLTRLDGEYDLNFLAQSQRPAILKVMRAGCEESFIDLQCSAFEHLAKSHQKMPVPGIIKTTSGDLYSKVQGPDGEPRIVWLLEKVEGKTYANFLPQSHALIADIGSVLGEVDSAWRDFSHPALTRDFKWNLCQGLWINEELAVITDTPKQQLIADICQAFSAIEQQLQALPQQAIHNDANDYNVIVDGSLTQAPHVTGLIDLGDMCAGPRYLQPRYRRSVYGVGAKRPRAGFRIDCSRLP